MLTSLALLCPPGLLPHQMNIPSTTVARCIKTIDGAFYVTCGAQAPTCRWNKQKVNTDRTKRRIAHHLLAKQGLSAIRATWRPTDHMHTGAQFAGARAVAMHAKRTGLPDMGNHRLTSMVHKTVKEVFC